MDEINNDRDDYERANVVESNTTSKKHSTDGRVLLYRDIFNRLKEEIDNNRKVTHQLVNYLIL